MKRSGWITLGALAVTGAVAWNLLGLQLIDVSKGVHNAFDFTQESTPPDWSVWQVGMQGLFETVLIAYLATIIGLVLSLPLAMVAARNLFPSFIGVPIRLVLAAIRVMPSVLWALLLVIMVGVGPMAGVIAMSLYTVGFLGKLQYESIEGLPGIGLETATAMGMSPWQRIRFVVLPESANSLISQALFMFEYNVRATTIIGIVGAGGIGRYIGIYQQLFLYDRVLALLIMIFVTVVLIDAVSARVRRRFTEPGTMRKARWRDLFKPIPPGPSG